MSDVDDARSPWVRYPQLKNEEGVPYSRSHLAVLEERGQFPRRIRLSPNVIAWDREEIRAWRASRQRGRA